MNNINTVRFPDRLPEDPFKPRKIIRQTHKICQFQTCSNNVSCYSHNYCKYCCYPDTLEYNYHYINTNNED